MTLVASLHHRSGTLRLRPSGRVVGLGLLTLLLAFLGLYPLAMLFYGSVHSTPPGVPGSFNLDGYRALMTYDNLAILGNTIAISLVKTLLSIVLAVLLAWIVGRTDTPGSRILEVLITLPFFIPPVLTAMSWGMLGNPQNGLINQFFRLFFGEDVTVIDVFSWGGVVWHMMQYSTPFLFLLIVDAFRSMDPVLEEASRMSGASRWTTFRRVTLVLMLPVLTSGFVLSFIRGVESFESPLFFGLPAGIKVLSIEIYYAINQSVTPNYQYATAIGVMTVALMFAIVALQRRILGGRSFQTVTGKGYSPGVVRLGWWRWVTFSFCLFFFFVTVLLPIGQLIAGSFFQYVGFYSWESLTLAHYSSVWDNERFWRSFANTMLLGFVGATATMALGGIVAYVLVRTKSKARRLIATLAWLPWMMPGIVLGVGFLWAFAAMPAMPIYGTIWALLLAYVALGTPLAVQVASAIYEQLSADLEECSRVHGASWLQTSLRIVVALAWPAFAVGWVLTFFGVMRELSASVMLYSINSEVLSVVMLGLWNEGKVEEVCVVGIILVALVLILRFAQLRLLRRGGRLVAT